MPGMTTAHLRETVGRSLTTATKLATAFLSIGDSVETKMGDIEVVSLTRVLAQTRVLPLTLDQWFDALAQAKSVRSLAVHAMFLELKQRESTAVGTLPMQTRVTLARAFLLGGYPETVRQLTALMSPDTKAFAQQVLPTDNRLRLVLIRQLCKSRFLPILHSAAPLETIALGASLQPLEFVAATSWLLQFGTMRDIKLLAHWFTLFSAAHGTIVNAFYRYVVPVAKRLTKPAVAVHVIENVRLLLVETTTRVHATTCTQMFVEALAWRTKRTRAFLTNAVANAILHLLRELYLRVPSTTESNDLTSRLAADSAAFDMFRVVYTALYPPFYRPRAVLRAAVRGDNSRAIAFMLARSNFDLTTLRQNARTAHANKHTQVAAQLDDAIKRSEADGAPIVCGRKRTRESVRQNECDEIVAASTLVAFTS